jgi:hypothetical protein
LGESPNRKIFDRVGASAPARFFQHPEVMPQQVRGIIADFTVGLHKIKQGKLAQKWKDFT